MDDFERKVIQDHFAQLKRELVPGDLVDLMYSKNIIGREVMDEVEAIPIQDKKNRRLLMALEDSPNKKSFSLFLECIEKADPVMAPIAAELRGEGNMSHFMCTQISLTHVYSLDHRPSPCIPCLRVPLIFLFQLLVCTPL